MKAIKLKKRIRITSQFILTRFGNQLLSESLHKVILLSMEWHWKKYVITSKVEGNQTKILLLTKTDEVESNQPTLAEITAKQE